MTGIIYPGFFLEKILLKKSDLLYALNKYHFIEISQIRFFIELFFFDNDNAAEEIYIISKIMRCLSLHDNGDDYFHDMRELISEMKKNIVS